MVQNPQEDPVTVQASIVMESAAYWLKEFGLMNQDEYEDMRHAQGSRAKAREVIQALQGRHNEQGSNYKATNALVHIMDGAGSLAAGLPLRAISCFTACLTVLLRIATEPAR